MFLAMALEGYASWIDHGEAQKLTFGITAVDDLERSRIIAAADNIDVAWAAFSAAIPKQTVGRLILHQAARVIAKHPPEQGPKLIGPPITK